MSRILPRTALVAAVNSVTIAARADHDERIAVGGRYHLFRLPTALEHALTGAISEDALHVQVLSVLTQGQVDLIREIAAISNGFRVGPADGPVKLGPVASIADMAGVKKLAAHYLISFETNRRSFPYFEAGEGRF